MRLTPPTALTHYLPGRTTVPEMLAAISFLGNGYTEFYVSDPKELQPDGQNISRLT